jgi:hypothetical protein
MPGLFRLEVPGVLVSGIGKSVAWAGEGADFVVARQTEAGLDLTYSTVERDFGTKVIATLRTVEVATNSSIEQIWVQNEEQLLAVANAMHAQQVRGVGVSVDERLDLF